MNGPEHYREAERLLNMLPSHGINPETGYDRAETFAAAQVHATLAHTAAVIETTMSRGPGDVSQIWTNLTHPGRPQS